MREPSAESPTHEEHEKGEEDRREKRQNGKSPAREGVNSSGGRVPVAGKGGNNPNKRRKTATGTFSRTAGSSSPYRTGYGSGLAPSDKMRLLLEARESTREAGEAGGSGRRPRVPSRKFLEASGKVVDEGVQWMTKEKREEQARKKRELKEQKKAAAAAGLRAGQVLETVAFRLPRGANRTGGALGGGGRAVAKVSWRKLTPTEILRVAGKQPASDGAQSNYANAPDASGVVAVSKSKQEEREPVSETDSMSKQKRVAAAGGSAAQQGSTVVGLPHENRPKRSETEHDAGPGGGKERAVKATCEFESCAKKASFGVNGVVRYW